MIMLSHRRPLLPGGSQSVGLAPKVRASWLFPKTGHHRMTRAQQRPKTHLQFDRLLADGNPVGQPR